MRDVPPAGCCKVPLEGMSREQATRIRWKNYFEYPDSGENNTVPTIYEFSTLDIPTRSEEIDLCHVAVGFDFPKKCLLRLILTVIFPPRKMLVDDEKANKILRRGCPYLRK